jgi:hypothetical protein
MARTANTPSGGTKGAAKAATSKSKIPPSAKAPAKPSAAAKATSPAVKKSGGGAAWLILLLLIAVAGGVGYLTYPRWYPALAAKVPGLPKLQIEDSRVAGLSDRIATLETRTGAIKAKDETIIRLEQEREKLSGQLARALVRLETVEKSMAAVREMAEAAASVEETTEAKQSLQRLSDRLASLEKKGIGGGAVTEQLAKLRDDQTQSRKLDGRLTKLEKKLADTALAGQTLSGVEKRLTKIESRTANTANVVGNTQPAGAAIILAVGQLRDAAARGIAYSREIEAVKALAGNDTGLTASLMPLDRHAKTGVATLSILRDEFTELAGKTVTRARAQTASGWFSKIAARVGALVTLRRTDSGGAPDSVEALVAKAESRLEAGDLAAAVAAVAATASLSTDAGEVVAPWLGRAKTRLTIERALAALHIHAVSTLGGANKETLGGANKETLSGAAKE